MRVVDSLPRNSSDKIDRLALEELDDAIDEHEVAGLLATVVGSGIMAERLAELQVELDALTEAECREQLVGALACRAAVLALDHLRDDDILEGGKLR